MLLTAHQYFHLNESGICISGHLVWEHASKGDQRLSQMTQVCTTLHRRQNTMIKYPINTMVGQSLTASTPPSCTAPNPGLEELALQE